MRRRCAERESARAAAGGVSEAQPRLYRGAKGSAAWRARQGLPGGGAGRVGHGHRRLGPDGPWWAGTDWVGLAVADSAQKENDVFLFQKVFSRVKKNLENLDNSLQLRKIL